MIPIRSVTMIFPFASRRLPARVSPALLEHRAAASNEICE
jgi:hypothetical protein